MAKKKSLKVKKNHNGVFRFTVYFMGVGKTAKQAWDSVDESICQEGIGKMPPRSQVIIMDQEPE